MGKQTRRQKAKKTIVDAGSELLASAAPSLPDANLCCLPHCEEPGEKLTCAHLFCGMDMLKLTRYVAQLKEFRITCPMCRKI